MNNCFDSVGHINRVLPPGNTILKEKNWIMTKSFSQVCSGLHRPSKRHAKNIKNLTAEANFVATIPGATQFTLILSCTTSLAIAFVRPKSVVLLTLYDPKG